MEQPQRTTPSQDTYGRYLTESCTMSDPSPGSHYEVIQEATEENPLAVGEFGTVPTSLTQGSDDAAIPLRHTLECARDGPWTAILVPDHKFPMESPYAWHIHVWYTNSLLSVEEQMNETTVTTIPLDGKFAAPPKLAIHHAHGSSATSAAVAFLYILQIEKGFLYGHQIKTTPTATPARPMVTSLPLAEEDRVVVFAAADGMANQHFLYAGTNQGRIFRVQPRPATHSLLYQDITADLKEQQKGKSRTSLFRLFSSSTSTLHTDPQDLVPAGTDGSFWTVTTQAVQLWQASPPSHTVAPLKMPYTLTTRLTAADGLPRRWEMVRVTQASPDVLYMLGMASPADDDELQWYAVRWTKQPGDNWHVAAVTWLNRLSASASCLAWEAAQNGLAWGAFVPVSSLPLPRYTVLSIVPTDHAGADHVYEYDGVLGESVVQGSFQADYTTHGVTFASQGGKWLRVECLAVQDAATTEIYLTRTDQERLLVSLLHHLTSTFQAYERGFSADQAIFIELPPSFKSPEAATVLDLVVAKLAVQHLPVDGMSGDLNKHVIYMDFLRQAGLYRSLRLHTKCQMLTIGEEISASLHVPFEELEEPFAWPESGGLMQWMERYQSNQVFHNPTPEKLQAWTAMLAQALKAARLYREDHADSVGNLTGIEAHVKKASDIPFFLCNLALQRTLTSFVNFQIRQNEASQFVLTTDMEEILHAVLDSFEMSSRVLPNSLEIRTAYTRMQAEVFTLFCSTEEKKDLAWLLSVKHRYFAGLCQLAKEYEKEPDTQFQLQTLFKELESKKDVETGLPFASFVLKWHVDRKLYGHALEYGEECPAELKRMVESDPGLAPFRWIVGIRNGNYDEAVQSLVKNAADDISTVAQTKVDMGLAKMANSLVQHDSEAVRGGSTFREKTIEKIRERANAQWELYGETKEAESQPLKSAEELLDYAIAHLDRQATVELKVLTGVRALAVCTTLDTTDEIRDSAVRVWLEALRVDYKYFKQFVFSSATIEVSKIQSNTVFGGLYMEALHTPDWDSSVKLESSVLDGVLEEISPEDRAGLSLLVRALSSH